MLGVFSIADEVKIRSHETEAESGSDKNSQCDGWCPEEDRQRVPASPSVPETCMAH